VIAYLPKNDEMAGTQRRSLAPREFMSPITYSVVMSNDQQGTIVTVGEEFELEPWWFR